MSVFSCKVIEGAWRFAGRFLNTACYFSRLAARVVRVVFDQTVGLPCLQPGPGERLPHRFGETSTNSIRRPRAPESLLAIPVRECLGASEVITFPLVPFFV